MKTREQMLAALDALQKVCQQHGVVLLGVCNAEGIYGEIELKEAADLAEDELARLAGQPEYFDPKTVCVNGIGAPASSQPEMNIDDQDEFGVPISRSFMPESELLRLFESIGVSVAEASQKRREGTLPKDIADAWDQYDALRKANTKGE